VLRKIHGAGGVSRRMKVGNVARMGEMKSAKKF
jgi:hypothetical protein